MEPKQIVLAVLLISLMLHTGLQVNVANLRAVLRNYGLLGRAFLANFVLVPLVAVLLVRALRLDDPIAGGILLMAIAPGVPFVTISGGRQRGGSLGFAVTLRFLLPLVSILTVPLTAPLVLPAHEAANVPLFNTIMDLIVLQLIPLVVGVVIAERASAVASKLIRPLNILLIALIATVFIFALPRIAHDIVTVHGSRGLLTALLVIFASAAIGWLLGGPELSYRHTLSIGTLLRNFGLAGVLANSIYANTPAGAMALSYFIIQLLVGTALGMMYAHSKTYPETVATS